jgi:hypothetical protein
MWHRSKEVKERIKPIKGFSHVIHIVLLVLLPILAYVLVRIDFVGLAIALIFLSKWRMFAVKPRYWLTNLVASGVDLMVAVSLVLFMANTSGGWWQIFWALCYGAWLLLLKSRSDVLSVSAQAMIGQLLGLGVLYLKFGDASLLTLVAGTWLVTYLSARHFLTSFEEHHTALLAHVWAYIGASLAFVLGHWLLFYGSIAQIIVFLTVIGYSLAGLYYLDASDKTTPALRRQLLGIMIAILLIVIIFSDWSGSTV